MSDAETLRALVRDWAAAVAHGNRAGVLAHHADDTLMYDFPDTVRGIDAYARTWDFFDGSRRGEVVFEPGEIAVTVGGSMGFAACEMHCEGTTAGPIDFRLTVGFERREGNWTTVHEHHSMPTRDETLIGPDVER